MISPKLGRAMMVIIDTCSATTSTTATKRILWRPMMVGTHELRGEGAAPPARPERPGRCRPLPNPILAEAERTEQVSTPIETQSVNRPPSATTASCATTRDHAARAALARHQDHQDQTKLSGIGPWAHRSFCLAINIPRQSAVERVHLAGHHDRGACDDKAERGVDPDHVDVLGPGRGGDAGDFGVLGA